MSRALFWRELRRHAPYALAFAVGAVALWAIGSQTAGPRDPSRLLASGATVNSQAYFTASAGLLLGGMLFASLAGVLTLAPDTARGGTAFLFRMPASPTQLAATKLSALVAYLPGLLLVGLAAHALEPQYYGTVNRWGVQATPGSSLLGTVSVGLALGLAFGLVSSVALNRVLPALLLAPILALGSFLALCLVPYAGWGTSPEGFYFVVLPVVSSFAVYAAWLGFSRGDPHQGGLKPALYSLAVLTPTAVALIGGTGVAKAWTVSGIDDQLEVSSRPAASSPDGQRLAVELHAQPWSGIELRVAVVDRTNGSQWVLPCDDVWQPQFSPDGTQLLVRNCAEPGGYLVDLTARTAQRLPGRSREGFGYQHLSWTARGPLFVEQIGTTVRSWQAVPGDADDPLRTGSEAKAREASYTVPASQILVAVHGKHAYFTDAEGVWSAPVPHRMELGDGSQAALELPTPERTQVLPFALSEFSRAELSPSGRYLATRAGGWVHVYDLRDGLQLESCEISGANPQDEHAIAFSPQEPVLAIVGTEEVAVHNPRDFVTRRFPLGSVPTGGIYWRQSILSWSPDGSLLGVNVLSHDLDAEAKSLVYSVESEGLVLPLGSKPLTGFVSDREVLVAEQPLGVMALVPASVGKDH